MCFHKRNYGLQQQLQSGIQKRVGMLHVRFRKTAKIPLAMSIPQDQVGKPLQLLLQSTSSPNNKKIINLISASIQKKIEK